MASIFDIQARVKQIDLRRIAEDILVSTEDELIKLNQEQLESGMDADSEEITPSYYSDAYAELKQRMNSKPKLGTPDLKDTGAFHGGIFLDIDRWNMWSADAKTPSLVKKYGNVLGLNEISLRKYRARTFRPRLSEEIKAIMSGQ